MNIDSGLQLFHNNKIIPLTNNYVVEIPANAAEATEATGVMGATGAIGAVAATPQIENRFITYLLEGIGWSGSILVLIPYIVAFEKSIDFALNTAGATGLLVICIKTRQFQSIIINAAWVVGGIYKYFF
jgi:hypothetical protein